MCIGTHLADGGENRVGILVKGRYYLVYGWCRTVKVDVQCHSIGNVCETEGLYALTQCAKTRDRAVGADSLYLDAASAKRCRVTVAGDTFCMPYRLQLIGQRCICQRLDEG